MMPTYEKKPEALAKLSPEQFDVTQRGGTERPFANAFWDNHEAGLYVDVVSGEPLFASVDKFDSGSGWPSFTRPVESENVVERRDISHGMVRTEVRSTHGDSHLGHLFPDGPREAGGKHISCDANSHGFMREIPQCWLTGQAAGAAAALAVDAGVQPRDVDIATLQKTLRAQGAFVREPVAEPAQP
jgi:methionine-R-sulfoxide reductase